jgi:hypothetical protein
MHYHYGHVFCFMTRHGRVSGETENLYCEEEPTDGSNGPERRASNEFSPLTAHQHRDYFSANIRDLFGDGSRKGSSSNLQPLDESGNILTISVN